MKQGIHQHGYTLIELLLYVTLIGVLLSGVAVFFSVTTESRVKNQSISEVNDQGAATMEVMTQAVRSATGISSPTVGITGSQLTLTVPTASLNPIVFSVASGVLQIKKGSATALPLTNNDVRVTAFSITNLTRSGTTGIVQINLTLQRLNTANRNEYDYQRTFTTSVGVRP
ncbi:MAG TPA: prepilin-type N-terminal cleavage/methylation domain-containing protein [Candidatus Saccharimonadales bacterium]|nr:prepilin-type N-terminal cleavage/methylation domain-containing protein [Candidatus Saccharimonadales bacterium]